MAECNNDGVVMSIAEMLEAIPDMAKKLSSDEFEKLRFEENAKIMTLLVSNAFTALANAFIIFDEDSRGIVGGSQIMESEVVEWGSKKDG